MRPADFPIVAIGASAGGLEAVSELLAAAAPRSGMAFIVVQHLDPSHQSLLPEILAKKTTMRVVSAAEGLTVEPDHVYVIPPNATLTLQDDVLRLAPRDRGGARHMPADALFKSLAETRGDSAIGVVLSGGDSDGALGTQQIKHSGGITFAQEPSSARFPSMPRNAIETECVDFVLHPSQIAAELGRLGGHPYLRSVGEPPDVSGGGRNPPPWRRTSECGVFSVGFAARTGSISHITSAAPCDVVSGGAWPCRESRTSPIM